MSMLIQEPGYLKRRNKELHEENELFRKFLLKQFGANQTDTLFKQSYAATSPLIDCTLCAACCSGLQPEISSEEYSRLSSQANQDHFIHAAGSTDGIERYYIKDPCCFLRSNRCSIYEERPEACKGYPHLDQPGIRYRLRTVFEQTGTCPIVFHVIEQLKSQTGFHHTN